MDAKNLIDVDINAIPTVQRMVEAPAVHESAAPPVFTKGLSTPWSAAVFAMSAIALLVLEIVAAGADPNAPEPSELVASIAGFVALFLVATPLFALFGSRMAPASGLLASVGLLGFQAECFIGGHTGFFAAPFLAVNVAVLGLVAVCGAALARR